MEKYLKKGAKQLQKEMLEMTQALEKIRQEKINTYGEIFLSIVESIDDAKRAEAYFKILEANASKSQKKILADDIEDLKQLANIKDEPIAKIDSNDSLNKEQAHTITIDNEDSHDEKADENLNNTVIKDV